MKLRIIRILKEVDLGLYEKKAYQLIGLKINLVILKILIVIKRHLILQSLSIALKIQNQMQAFS